MLGQTPLGTAYLGSAGLVPSALSPRLPNVLATTGLKPLYAVEVLVGKFMPFWINHSATAWKVAETDRVTVVKVNGQTLFQVNSIADVEANPGSWFWDRETLYVQTPTNASPMDADQDILILLKFYWASETLDLDGKEWEGRIKDLPGMSLRIEDEFGDIDQVGGGSLTLNNNDSFFNSRFNYEWDAGTVKLYMGAKGLPFFDYWNFATLDIINQDNDDRDFVLKMQELKGRGVAKRKVPVNFYTRGVYPAMNQETEGRAIQLAYGTVLGGEALVIDRTNRRFKVAGHSIRLYRGVKVLTDQTWNTVGFETTDLVNGEFTLSALDWDGEQAVSVDFDGRVLPNGELMENASDMLLDILQQSGEVRINQASFDTAHDFLDFGYVFQNSDRRATARTPSLYINTETPILDIVTQINEVVGSYLVTDANGEYFFKVFDQQRGQALKTFSDDEIINDTFNELVEPGREISKVVVRFATRLSEDADQVIELERPKNQYLRDEANAVVKTIELATTSRDSARRVAQRMLTLSEHQPIRYKVRIKWRAFVMRVADQVRLKYDHQGIDAIVEILSWKPTVGEESYVDLILGNLHGFDNITGFWSESGEITPQGVSLDWPPTSPGERKFKRQNSGHWSNLQDFSTDSPTDRDDYLTSVWSG